MITKNFMEFLIELKEWKYLKPKGTYGSKSILISKIELNNICQKINIDPKEMKFISSGSNGNAYSLGDKVLKITTDKREAKMAWDLIKNDNKSIVKYYSVWRYKSKGMFWIIIMDKLEELNEFINNHLKNKQGYIDLSNLATDIIFNKWGNLTKELYLKEIEDEYVLDTPFSKKLISQIWDCYFNLKEMPKLDFHTYNLGYNKERVLVLFDITPINSRINRFDDIPIINL